MNSHGRDTVRHPRYNSVVRSVSGRGIPRKSDDSCRRPVRVESVGVTTRVRGLGRQRNDDQKGYNVTTRKRVNRKNDVKSDLQVTVKGLVPNQGELLFKLTDV